MTSLATRTSIDTVLEQVRQANWSYALFREPNSKVITLMASPHLQHAEPRIVGARTGFAIRPFDEEPGFVLSAIFLAEWRDGELIQTQGEIASITAETKLPDPAPQKTSNSTYPDRVHRACRALHEGIADKVVMSDTVRLPVPSEDPLTVWKRLEAAYPAAFVSMVRTPEFGLWLGATPELLVGWEASRYVRTMALAGTQAMPKSGDPDDSTWSQKEIEEHAFVVRHIIERFKQIRLREYEETGPRAVAAGPVVHLRTDFVIDAHATERTTLPDDLRARLHPTSAVCGSPTEAALQMIRQIEPHDRQLYAGYWGPLALRNESHLYVNLRCLRWYDDAIDLFVGGGITRSSDPEREAIEIQLKAETLRAVIDGRR